MNARKPPPEANGPPHNRVLVLIVIGILSFVALVMVVLYFEGQGIIVDRGLIVDRFPALVGLPLSAALALLIVVLLPQAYGKIEFKALGISFRGAAGPVVLWLLCFLGITAAIKAMW